MTRNRRAVLRRLAWTAASVMLAAGVLKGAPVAEAQHSSPPAADAKQVVVDNFAFGPAVVTIPVGATVTWTNHDDIPHNVVSTERKFKSPVLDTDEAFSHTFDVAGTYKYYCSIHPRMTGQVVVR